MAELFGAFRNDRWNLLSSEHSESMLQDHAKRSETPLFKQQPGTQSNEKVANDVRQSVCVCVWVGRWVGGWVFVLRVWVYDALLCFAASWLWQVWTHSSSSNRATMPALHHVS